MTRIEERRPEDGANEKRVEYTVTPTRCLLRSDYIVTAQLLKNADEPVDTRPTPGVYL